MSRYLCYLMVISGNPKAFRHKKYTNSFISLNLGLNFGKAKSRTVIENTMYISNKYLKEGNIYRQCCTNITMNNKDY